jgi:membrane protein implicated in regulation of membrane protease activity
MQWDLGLQGLGLLVVMSIAFGVVAHLAVATFTTRWLWLIAAAAYFVVGLIISEVWFGWATEAELQPNIDGLSFDEVLLGGIVSGIVAVVVTWFVTRSRHRRNLVDRSPRTVVGSRGTTRPLNETTDGERR